MLSGVWAGCARPTSRATRIACVETWLVLETIGCFGLLARHQTKIGNRQVLCSRREVSITVCLEAFWCRGDRSPPFVPARLSCITERHRFIRRSRFLTILASLLAPRLQQGHLHYYRLCDEVWTFIVKNAQLKLDNAELVPVERVKIVACKMAESSAQGANK